MVEDPKVLVFGVQNLFLWIKNPQIYLQQFSDSFSHLLNYKRGPKFYFVIVRNILFLGEWSGHIFSQLKALESAGIFIMHANQFYYKLKTRNIRLKIQLIKLTQYKNSTNNFFSQLRMPCQLFTYLKFFQVFRDRHCEYLHTLNPMFYFYTP